LIKEVDLEYLIEEIPEAIGQSQEGLKRVTEIVKAMKTFSHPGNEEVVPVNINEAIKSTITVARNEWKYLADMKTDFDTELPMIPCFPGEFNQVILNMIINATHAIEEVSKSGLNGKGVISISTHFDKEWAEIRIRDTGIGIPEECRSKLFEPFFTTKEVGKGTGQGLAIAHSVIVGKHKGTINFDTEMGKGTTFIIRLPTLLPETIKV
jgi:signal transduction histidine kinase